MCRVLFAWERGCRLGGDRPVRFQVACRMIALIVLTASLFGSAPQLAHAQGSFVNWENAPVHPMDITPDGNTLLVTHLADQRVLMFDLTSGTPVLTASVMVGVDPVSVRARSNSEAWVVNHISDSVSVVDLTTPRVVATLDTEDEPCDVVFAGSPVRAFVSCSQANSVLVFDPNDLAAVASRVAIVGEDPRALAVSPDGSTVYAAVFESGNNTTLLAGGAEDDNVIVFPKNVVSDPLGPYGGQNPPPNDGTSFVPAQNPSNPAPPRVGLIVRKNDQGQWFDDNGGDWTDLVSGSLSAQSDRPAGWDLYDHDVAAIDANSLSVSYATGLMNLCMGVDVNPATGAITVIGTDADNHIRFEPNLTGTFIHVLLANVDATTLTMTGTAVDLNPHLDYTVPTEPQSVRDLSIGDPRCIEWNGAGTVAYVAGRGSNNIVVVNAAGARSGVTPTIEVGEGPTGLALDEVRNQLYVFNHFDGSISVVDTLTETEVTQVSFFDPTPLAIREGRKHLYDTRKNSGLGQASCGSCHIDSRMDRLAWDLGDPAGEEVQFDQNCLPLDTNCEDWHPMKGPMTTQTLQDIIGHEPLHWRGDRDGIEAFNGAFIGLQGDDTNLTPTEMQEFEDFLATIHYPPNPFRNFDNTLPTSLPLDGQFTTGVFVAPGQPLPNGNAVAGLSVYRTALLDPPIFNCVTCHTLPVGSGTDHSFNFFTQRYVPIAPGPNGERHHTVTSFDGSTNGNIKVPQLRNLYEKIGFDLTQPTNLAGFGFLHDGSVDTIGRFLSEPAFDVANVQELANLVAFMMAFSGSELPQGSVANITEPPGTPSLDSHAAVGMQLTLNSLNNAETAIVVLLAEFMDMANAGRIGLIAKGPQGGIARGYHYVGGDMFQSDRSAEQLTSSQLRAAAIDGSELTFTVVPTIAAERLGIDRDEDGFYDRDELDACSDPADATSVPGAGSCNPQFIRGDCNGDGNRWLDRRHHVVESALLGRGRKLSRRLRL